jgi:dihydrofolate synthase/folylpolyglutamate synthase
MEGFWIPFLGPFQVVNATTAIATLDQLYRRGVALSLEHVSQGLRSARWPGRLEILGRAPLLVMDGAHNVDSIQRMMQTLVQDLTFKRLFVVAGFSADKDIAGMMEELTTRADELILTKSIHLRSADPHGIVRTTESTRARMTAINDVPSALWETLERAGEEDLVCVTGSLFVVAEARAAWLDAEGVDFDRDPPML